MMTWISFDFSKKCCQSISYNLYTKIPNLFQETRFTDLQIMELWNTFQETRFTYLQIMELWNTIQETRFTDLQIMEL